MWRFWVGNGTRCDKWRSSQTENAEMEQAGRQAGREWEACSESAVKEAEDITLSLNYHGSTWILLNYNPNSLRTLSSAALAGTCDRCHSDWLPLLTPACVTDEQQCQDLMLLHMLSIRGRSKIFCSYSCEDTGQEVAYNKQHLNLLPIQRI